MEAIEPAVAWLSTLTVELREVRKERRSFECERAARHEREIDSDPGGANVRMVAEPQGKAVAPRGRGGMVVPPDHERVFLDE